MSAVSPISVPSFVVSGWNFFSKITPQPTSINRMVAIGIIVSAVAMVLLAKISFLAGFTLTLGAYTLVNHSDLKAFTRAQKELEDKLLSLNGGNRSILPANKDFKEVLSKLTTEDNLLIEDIRSITRQLPELQENYITCLNLVQELQQNTDIVDSKLIESLRITDEVSAGLKLLEKKNLDLDAGLVAVFKEVGSFKEDLDAFKEKISSLSTVKTQFESVVQQIDLIQEVDRGNYENLNSSLLESSAKLELVTQKLEKFTSIDSQIQRMDQRLSECWEISQRFNQQQGQRMAPAQQFQQVVRSAQGLGYRR
ncbi:MAG: hypothetical protein FJZ62_04770 [Chlamydiae bacterium]|nr:hypothetical protein [Chlamydiota bacterium]